MLDDHTDSASVQHRSAQLPAPGEIMPDFTLASPGGEHLRISDYRGRRNLILIFSGTGDSETERRLLRKFSEIYSEFVREEAQVLAIVQGPKDQVEHLKKNEGLPFPVLADAHNRAHLLVGASGAEQNGTPVVYVIDRYGEIRHVYHAEQPGHSPAAREALEWVRYINLECPE